MLVMNVVLSAEAAMRKPDAVGDLEMTVSGLSPLAFAPSRSRLYWLRRAPS